MTKCILPYVGVFSSHRGTSLCCKAEKFDVDPLEFYNGAIQKEVRHMMDNNQEHELCKGCYDSERLGLTSDRIIHNTATKKWSGEALEYPQWLDLDWSNFCNLKCIMCGPERSSTWAKETNDYTDTDYKRQATQQHINEIYRLSSTNLRYLNLQGGEPSMIKEYDDYLQHLIDIGAAPNCEVTVVTNLTNINKQFYKRLENFKSISLGVSIDAFGTVNDFVRYPSKFRITDRNFKWIADTSFEVSIDISFITPTMFEFDKFLVWLYEVQQYFKQRGKTVQININKVEYPNQLHYLNAPKKLKEQFLYAVQQYKKGNKRLSSAVRFEISMMQIVKQLNDVPHATDKPFVDYMNAIAKTRKLNLNNYIPQLETMLD
jgi:sulfatase maturation enzyme AslB (radical SAM superfamily)